MFMENDQQLTERLEQATTLLERTLAWLEERGLAGDIEKISATVDAAAVAREEELAGKLAAAETEIAELRAAAVQPSAAPQAAQVLRKTVPASTSDMLAKHGIGEGPVDVRTLDTALAGLSLEQRIAVKSQLLRAGALA
jgi:hypothetical protein